MARCEEQQRSAVAKVDGALEQLATSRASLAETGVEERRRLVRAVEKELERRAEEARNALVGVSGGCHWLVMCAVVCRLLHLTQEAELAALVGMAEGLLASLESPAALLATLESPGAPATLAVIVALSSLPAFLRCRRPGGGRGRHRHHAPTLELVSRQEGVEGLDGASPPGPAGAAAAPVSVFIPSFYRKNLSSLFRQRYLSFTISSSSPASRASSAASPRTRRRGSPARWVVDALWLGLLWSPLRGIP